MNKSRREEELVKYMSNLPGYLRRMDTGETRQEKALNFGVLDWNRLEKWKHHKELDEEAQSNRGNHSAARRKLPPLEDEAVTNKEANGRQQQQNIVLLLPKDLPRKSFSDFSSLADAGTMPANGSRRSCSYAHSSSLPDRFPELYSDSPKQTTDESRRNSSPTIRSGLGRSEVMMVRRSLSSKEGSRVSHTPPSLPRPETSEDSRRGSRSSPFKRLLAPLLRPKSAGNRRSSGKDPPEKTKCRNFGPINFSLNVPTVSHALLQITAKNGVPLFKFVVDDECDALATTVNKSAGNISALLYTIYAVREVKKTVSWMNQANRNKNGNYVYDTIGKIKISCHDRGVTEIRESVLCVAGDQKTAIDKELAAIVTEIPLAKNENQNAGRKTTVIIPRGVHGVPTNGLPSSLIDRWKSGGSCDCGGWDVGCRLRVFADQPRAAPSSTQFDLFSQGERERRPALSMVAYRNGICSVEFSRSLSALQAFSICVAYMNGRRWADLNTAAVELPPRYVPFLPQSPVGRA